MDLRLPSWLAGRKTGVARQASSVTFLPCTGDISSETKALLRGAVEAERSKIHCAYLVEVEIDTGDPRPAVAIELAPGVSAEDRKQITFVLSRCVPVDPGAGAHSHGLMVCILEGPELAEAKRVG